MDARIQPGRIALPSLRPVHPAIRHHVRGHRLFSVDCHQRSAQPRAASTDSSSARLRV